MQIAKLVLLWASALLLIYVSYFLGEIRTKNYSDRTFFGYSFSTRLIEANNELLNLDLDEYRETVVSNCREALRKAPINHDVFLQMAKIAHSNNEKLYARALVDEASRRKMRDRKVIKFSIQLASEVGNLHKIIDEIDLLYRLNFKNHQDYIKILSAMHAVPEGRKYINEKLRTNPIWGHDFLSFKIKNLSGAALLNLNQSLDVFLPAYDSNQNKLNLISDYAQQLIRNNFPDEAENFWIKTQDQKLVSSLKGSGLINPLFIRTNLSPPFNWLIANTPNITTEMNPEGGFFATFEGEKDTTLAFQTFRWPKESKASVHYQAIISAQKSRGGFYLLLDCQSPTFFIKVIPLNYLFRNEIVKSDWVSLPNKECKMARILILAKPGMLAGEISLFIKSLDIEFITNEDFEIDGGGNHN